MSNVREVFNDRKREVEFYFSVILDFDTNKDKVIKTIDNAQFFRIMKSNFILMLYNLVEATVTTGILEIYDKLNCDKSTYDDVIEEIQKIWRNYMIKQIYKPESKLETYEKRILQMINDITSGTPIKMNKHMIGMDGNLNAKRIKDICDKHRIRYRVIDDDGKLEEVRKKRNELAHGDVSFGKCARDFSVIDLENIKDKIFNFLLGIIDGMDQYCEEKKYQK